MVDGIGKNVSNALHNIGEGVADGASKAGNAANEAAKNAADAASTMAKKAAGGAGDPKGGITDAADRFRKNAQSSLSQLMYTLQANQSNLEMIMHRAASDVSRNLGTVVDQTGKLMNQMQEMKKTVEGYAGKAAGTAAGPPRKMLSHINGTLGRLGGAEGPIGSLTKQIGEQMKTGPEEISGFPDVVKTPNPGGPIPLPYANIGSDPSKVRIGEKGQPAVKWAKGVADAVRREGAWLSDWAKGNADATGELAAQAASSPDLARDLGEQSKAAMETAKSIAESVGKVQGGLQKLIGGDPLPPSVNHRKL